MGSRLQRRRRAGLGLRVRPVHLHACGRLITPRFVDTPPLVLRFAGTPAEAGHAYGTAIRAWIAHNLDDYLDRVCATNRITREHLSAHAKRWIETCLPDHFAEQLHAMGEGARLSTQRMAEFIDADSASGTTMLCSGIALSHVGHAWVGRNADWLAAILSRGTCAYIHDIRGRIPCMGLGVVGDFDIDTGVNAERLWIHVHTLLAQDEVTGTKPVIDWLFFAREALETCTDIDHVETLLNHYERNRGMILHVTDGKTNDSAIFECTRTTHERIDRERDALLGTNHPLDRHPSAEREAKSSTGSTIARLRCLRTAMEQGSDAHPRERLARALGDPGVELSRTPRLQTIYSAICCPGSGEVWFASGPRAASRQPWHRVPWPW